MNPDTAPTQLPTSSPEKKKPPFMVIVLLAMGLLLIIFAVYAFTHTKKTTTITNKASTTTVTAKVSITETGFSPATLQVKSGTTVSWTNNGTTVHQVAADPYPKDDSIPNFDSTVILNKGDTFSFNFSNAGTYTYHDERNPLTLKGIIVVK